MSGAGAGLAVALTAVVTIVPALVTGCVALVVIGAARGLIGLAVTAGPLRLLT